MEPIIVIRNIKIITGNRRVKKVIMIDIHSHVLPKVDDGSSSLNMTYDMLKKYSKEGIKRVIATPHYCTGYSEVPIRKVKAMVRMLNKLAVKKCIDIMLYPGQEVYLTEKTVDDYNLKKAGTLNNSRYMLIEFNMFEFNRNIVSNIYELRLLGIVPIIAHPERYKPVVKNPCIINDLINEGCLFQLDSKSIEGRFGWKIKRTAEILINNNIYNFIGSDAHDNKKSIIGTSNGLKLIEKRNKLYKDIFRTSSELLIKNEIIDFEGEKIKKKRLHFIMKYV